MKNHLTSEDHSEIVAMINRSVAIVVKKVTLSPCPHCQKKFRFKFGLARHLSLFHPPKEEMCRLCDYKSAQKSKMRQHYFLAHMKQKQKEFSCFICRKTFRSKLAAIKHKSSQGHLRKKQVENIEQMSCHLCGLEFSSTSNLLAHLKSDHLEDMSQCCLCGQLFPNAQQLSSHLRSRCHPQENQLEHGHSCPFKVRF